MSFIDTATGSPDKFELEVLEAFGHLNVHGQSKFCVMAGAAYLQQVYKRLMLNQRITSPDQVKQVGTASLIIQTSHGRVYCQAVNDRYTEAWPLPWIVAADRKSTMPAPASSPSAEQMAETINRDMEAFVGLYVPDAETTPTEVVVRYSKPWPGITDNSGGYRTLKSTLRSVLGTKMHDVTVVVKPGSISPVQQFCLDYPWKAPNRVANYLEPRAGKPVPPPVVSEPVKPAGPKEKTLADVMTERRKQSRWGG